MNPLDENTIKQCNDCASKGLKYSLNNGRPQVMISEDYMREARDGMSYMQQASVLAEMIAKAEFGTELNQAESAITNPAGAEAYPFTDNAPISEPAPPTNSPTIVKTKPPLPTIVESARLPQPKPQRNQTSVQLFGAEVLGDGLLSGGSAANHQFTLAQTDGLDVLGLSPKDGISQTIQFTLGGSNGTEIQPLSSNCKVTGKKSKSECEEHLATNPCLKTLWKDEDCMGEVVKNAVVELCMTGWLYFCWDENLLKYDGDDLANGRINTVGIKGSAAVVFGQRWVALKKEPTCEDLLNALQIISEYTDPHHEAYKAVKKAMNQAGNTCAATSSRKAVRDYADAWEYIKFMKELAEALGDSVEDTLDDAIDRADDDGDAAALNTFKATKENLGRLQQIAKGVDVILKAKKYLDQIRDCVEFAKDFAKWKSWEEIWRYDESKVELNTPGIGGATVKCLYATLEAAGAGFVLGGSVDILFKLSSAEYLAKKLLEKTWKDTVSKCPDYNKNK